MKSLLRLGCLAAVLAQSAIPQAPATVTQLKQGFLRPPDDARMMVRWWWFGPSVTAPELEREMRLMKEGGIGGFEVQATYPLEVEGNYPYLSPSSSTACASPARRPASSASAWT